MKNEKIIKEVVRIALDVAEEDIRVRGRLMGGRSNYMYVVEVNGEVYTFRIPGKNAEKFVSRIIEAYHIELIKDLGISNDTLFYDTRCGYKMARYVAGEAVSMVNALDYLEEVSEVLHRLHDSRRISSYDYDAIGRLEKYERYVVEYGYEHGKCYKELKGHFMRLKDIYINSVRYRLCHGDAQVANFIKKVDGRLLLVDWEFAGNNDPFYDIACFGNQDFAHALALLAVYLGREPKLEEYNRLYFLRGFQCLQWHNVALYKSFIGLSADLGVDFMLMANLYLNKAERFLASMR